MTLNVIVVSAGSMLLMWIGELISEFGIGNGVSLIIFAGIVSRLPSDITQFMISVLDVIVRTLLIVGLGNLYAAPGPVLLVKEFDPQNTVHAVLAIVNVMTFWLLGVRAMGLARISGVTFAKAALWVFGIWLAYTGFFVALGVLMRTVFKRVGG